MDMLKKAVNVIFYYILETIIANLAVGILSLILRISLVTVQGPTSFSRISEILTYYITFSVSSSLLFRLLRKKQLQIMQKEIILFGSLIVLLHLAIIIFGSWNMIWSITNSTIPLVTFLYTNGKTIDSLRDIPKFYYFIALFIKDICFINFSLIGSSKGVSKIKKSLLFWICII